MTNDDHRRMVLQAQYLSKRSLIDHVLAPIAEMASDGRLAFDEIFIYNLYLEVLAANKVPKSIIEFISGRVKERSDIYKPKVREEKEMPRLIRSSIVSEESSLNYNPQYARALEVITDMNVPARQRAKELEEMKHRYNSQFMMELAKFIDEMPEEGEDNFADCFYRHFSTTKKGIVKRIKAMANTEKTIENAGMGIFLVQNALSGYIPIKKEFETFVNGMAALPESLRERALNNIRTWGEGKAGKEVVDAITGAVTRNNIESIALETDKAWSGLFEGQNGEASESLTLSQLFESVQKRVKEIQERYSIKPDMGVTDDDLEGVFEVYKF